MSQAWRLGFEFSAADDAHSADDARWSLTGFMPAAPLRTGSFAASDGADVPSRLWPVKQPRALVLLLHGATDYSGAFDEIGPQFAAQSRVAFVSVDAHTRPCSPPTS
jgi:hypothetical protein